MRVAVAEDHALMREGLVLLLRSSGMEVTAACDNAVDFIAAVTADRPDAVIVDLRMPPTRTDDGLRAAIQLRRVHPGLPVLVLSSSIEPEHAGDLLADGAGGVGYLLEERVEKVADFLDVLRRIAFGATVLDPEVLARIVRGYRADPLAALTTREREVLALMAEGHNNTAIAEHLLVSNAAVHKHIRAIFAKLDLSSEDRVHRRVQAVLAYLDA
ncbi:response regulator transcription factor [Nocardia sp. NPDC004278]